MQITPLTHFINGKSYIDKDEKLNPIMNPAQGKEIGLVPFASSLTINKAIEAAKTAYLSWSSTTPLKRSKLFFAFREILLAKQAELAQVVTNEHGKTLDDAKGSIARGIELIEWYCGLVSHWQTPLTNNAATDIDCYTLREPLGVCVGVSPFNFPVMVPIWMMIPAIAAGNTFILKPSEQDPTAALLLATWFTEVGLPPGVINIIHGDKATVSQLITQEEVKAVTAVASTKVASSIYQQAVSLNKRAHTFGGAKNHAVVMMDADLKEAAKAIVGAAYGSAGERCMALSCVVAVGKQCKEDFLKELIPLAKAIRIGKGNEPNIDMGPLISANHLKKVTAMVNLGVQEGALLLLDGREFKHPKHKDGYFLGPCLFDNVKQTMQIYQEEIFGPVLVVLVAKSFAEALNIVNTNHFGNGAAIFTQDGGVARDFVEGVTVGMVGVNIPIPVPIVSHSFGGFKQSSFGDTPMHGMESLHFYTKLKTVTAKWRRVTKNTSEFVMPTHTD